MVDPRERRRLKARQLRAIEKGKALAVAEANCDLVARALRKARTVVADPGLTGFLHRKDVQSIPKCLVLEADWPEGKGTNTNEALDRISLDFAVAWRFLYPFLIDTQSKSYLDTAWPGFIPEMKDAFIALVVDGPFPFSMSGYRGRRHQRN